MKTAERCPHCQQIIPVPDLFPAAPVKQRIYNYIAKHPEGVTREWIVNHVYGDDPEGGPEHGSTIREHVHQMRPVLKQHGLNIECRGANTYARYHLIGTA